MKWKRWREWSTKASDASKRGSLVVSNPRCLISQIAVTFDEGDRADARRETGPVREGVWVFFFFLLMCTVQIQLCPLLLNKSFFKYELRCLQQFSASRHHPLSLPTLPLFIWHCLLSYLLYILCWSDAPSPHFLQNMHVVACCMHTHVHMRIRLGTREKEKKKERKTVCLQERSLWGLVLYSAGVSWFVACRLMRVCVCVHTHMCVAQTKAPSQTPVNRLARLLRNKGLRENADFTGKGREPRLCV